MRNYQWTLQVSISIFKMYSIGKYWWFSFLELLLEVARGLGFDLKEIKPKVPLRKYSSKKLNFRDHHKLGRYCYGKPNHTNFVWSVCGTYVCRTGRSAGRGSSWDKKRWHFNQIKGYINTLDVAHQRIQHQKIQQLEGNEEDDGEEDMVEEETAIGRTTAKKDKMPATVDNELIDRWRWNNTHC